MIGTLYRYAHPYDSAQFLYCGQGSDRDRHHRSGHSSFGRRFKEKFPDIELPEPIREQIEVSSPIDLNEEETIWIFRYHTWWRYPNGMNITLPGSVDYKSQGLITGRLNAKNGRMQRISTPETCAKGGRIGGRRRIELHGNPLTPESCAKGGRITGRINGRRAFENNTGIFALDFDINAARCKAGRKNFESGHMKNLGNSGIGLCFRWNIKRGKPCVCGKHGRKA
jgi:hypothetical protein